MGPVYGPEVLPKHFQHALPSIYITQSMAAQKHTRRLLKQSCTEVFHFQYWPPDINPPDLGLLEFYLHASAFNWDWQISVVPLEERTKVLAGIGPASATLPQFVEKIRLAFSHEASMNQTLVQLRTCNDICRRVSTLSDPADH